MKIKTKLEGKDVIFELQGMDSLDYYDIQTAFKMGQMKFSDYGQAIIRECVIEPKEAKDIDFFRDYPQLLDKLIFQCANLSKVGLSNEPKIEFVEENEQKEEQNSISMKTTKGGN